MQGRARRERSGVDSEDRRPSDDYHVLGSFWGFQPNDHSFRTLLRIIKSQAGSPKLKNFPQVGVQIDIQEDDLIHAQRRAYLQDYFKKAAVETFAIFWGTAGEFLQELDRRLHDG